jgi:FMN-dependent NADH-azoreductase
MVVLGARAPRRKPMKNLFRLDSSARTEGSISRQIGDHLQQVWTAHNPQHQLVQRDLAANPIAPIKNQTIAGFYAKTLTPDLQAATAQSDVLIGELEQADTILLTTPMYNFSIPGGLKNWLDQIVRIGKTFAFDGSNFHGLLANKTTYVVIAYGASGYGAGEGFAAANFVKPYLQFILGFLGIANVVFFELQATSTGSQTETENALAQLKAEIEKHFAALTALPQLEKAA